MLYKFSRIKLSYTYIYMRIHTYVNICIYTYTCTGHFRCKKSHTRDNNRKCLFWVSYCVIILHALYMICNTKGSTSCEGVTKGIKETSNGTLKMCTPLRWFFVIIRHPEISNAERLNKACLRQPLCSLCCQCYADIVSHRNETIYASFFFFLETDPTSRYLHVVKNCSLGNFLLPVKRKMQRRRDQG